MPLSWNEIRSRALDFSREWAEETSESAEAKSFWDAFFNVFGISRRRVASFERPVRDSDGRGGFIDLLWKGVLLVEHKSRGKDLDRAARQALDYFPGLKERDLPRYVVVSDFARLRLYDLEEGGPPHEFALKDLYKHIRLFGFMAGYETRSFGQEDPVNIKAAERLGRLHDLLKESGYAGHNLEVFLVRLLFCLFADDTTIFERRQFQDYIEQRTAEDGSDLGMHLGQLFQVLNTPPDARSTNLDEQLNTFRFVDGGLFEEQLPFASFNRGMREMLLDCCALNWGRISPAVFGSLFQSIMDKEARRNLGAHYTSETNILKALRPLFVDALRAEFEHVRRSTKQLYEFHKKLGTIRVFDPACGCGNFLVVAYRELRLLELEVLVLLHKHKGNTLFDVSHMVFVDVDQFYGIEIEEFPAQIAQVALWLTDHQMNLRVSEEFGQYFSRLPLAKAPNIAHGNALSLNWCGIVEPRMLSYIVGNPPFVGAKHLSADQRDDVALVFQGTKNARLLDYVACWYRKAAEYMAANPAIRTAFVSTNSIAQGEQPGILWDDLHRRGARINFAHRTFQWSSEARGRSAVHCVIVGFSLQDEPAKWLFEYESPKEEPQAVKAANINPYLVDAPNVALTGRRTQLSGAPPIVFGSMPNDGGNLLLTPAEKDELLRRQPEAKPWLRHFLGSNEFIKNTERWCLWLLDVAPSELRRAPAILERVEAVRNYRNASKRSATREIASTPTLFGEIRQPRTGTYLLIPRHSSENRAFIPIGYVSADVIAGDANMVVPGASPYHFGVLASTMHMAWVRAVCGRLESRYRYSAGIVYNNFPWPSPSDKQRAVVEAGAQGVLDARAQFPEATLADLYDPVSMPRALVKAHQALDRAVDRAYRGKAFGTETERVAYLFERYAALTDS